MDVTRSSRSKDRVGDEGDSKELDPQTWTEEVADEMVEKLCQMEQIQVLEWLEELLQPKCYVCQLSRSRRDLVTNIQIETLENITKISTTTLVNSGCTSSTFSWAFVERHNIPTHTMAAPITMYNVDGTKNQAGQITAFAEACIKISDHAEWINLTITDLKDWTIFLGHDWLARHNPLINWKTGKIIFDRCHCSKTPIALPVVDLYDKWDKELEEGETILAMNFEEAIQIRAMWHVTNNLATKANTEKKVKTFEEMVPNWCRDFKDLFDKDNFNKLPKPKPWDHTIELTLNANANLDCKVYPLNHTEQEEFDNFLDENLSSRRIQPSKSPMASPFFFVKKKDGKLQPVQDYRKLNEMTIKTGIHYHSSLSSWTNCEAPSTSQNWMFVGDITMFVSSKVMNGKQHSELIRAYMSQLSCSSDSQILPPPFSGWWTTSLKT